MVDPTPHPRSDTLKDLVRQEIRSVFRDSLHVNIGDAKSLQELNADLDWAHRSRKANEATGLWARRALVGAAVAGILAACYQALKGGQG